MAGKKSTRSGRSYISRQTEPAPLPTGRRGAAYVRLAHPLTYGLYFNKDDAIVPWTSKGYTRWSIAEWEGKFGAAVDSGEDQRKWDFFGYKIPLYDDTKT